MIEPSAILKIEGLTRFFPAPSQEAVNGVRPVLRALDGVSLSLARGETLGIIGESGSGKSTLARLALGLDHPTGGTVHLDGKDLATLSSAAWRAMRPRAQYVFQDPSGSLNPRLRVSEQIREGLDIHGLGAGRQRAQLVMEALAAVGLQANLAERFPHQLSGGQQQRVVIARAIVLKPALLVADEPVSALDLTVQAQVVSLLGRLQRETGMAMLFISHDLKVVRKVTERLIVLYLGRVVEEGSTAVIFANARHPYTKALLGAMLPVDPRGKQESRFRISGDPPSPLLLPSGCSLQPRCPFAIDICRRRQPALSSCGSGHKAACHRAAEIPRLLAQSPQKDMENA